MSDEEFEFGTLTVTIPEGRDSAGTEYRLEVDRLAAAIDGTVYLLSVAGPSGKVRALRAALSPSVKASLKVEGIRCSNGRRSGSANAIQKEAEHGYSFAGHPLGYGNHHALFLSRSPSFLRVMDDEALYQALRNPRYTTPLLRHWVPDVRGRLEEDELLTRLYCWRCDCGLLTADTAQLDRAVAASILAGTATFRENAA